MPPAGRIREAAPLRAAAAARFVCGMPSASRREHDPALHSLRGITDRCRYYVRRVVRMPVDGSAIISHSRSRREEVHELVHRRLFQPLLVLAQREDRLLLLRRIAASEIGFELDDQLRYAFRAPP